MTATHEAFVVDNDTTRDELIECVRVCNEDAKRIHRRGLVGVRSAEYDRIHDRLDDALTNLEMWTT